MYKLGQIIEERKTIWECASGTCIPLEIVEKWEVTDILFDGDIVLGKCEGNIKILYQRKPYVVGCNKPIPLIYHFNN